MVRTAFYHRSCNKANSQKADTTLARGDELEQDTQSLALLSVNLSSLITRGPNEDQFFTA